MISSAGSSAMPGLANAAAYLMQNSGTRDLFERLLQVGSQQLQPAVIRVDYVESGQAHARQAHADAIQEPVAQQFSERYLGPVAKSALTGESSGTVLTHYQNENQQLSVICAPIVKSERVLGAVTVLTANRDQHSLDLMVARVDSLGAMASAACLGRPTATAEDSGAEASFAKQAGAVAATAHFTSANEFAYGLVNQLSAQLKAETVSMGIESAGRVQIMAVSGVAEVKHRTPGVTALSQLMEECLDHGEPVIAQTEPVEGVRSLPIHRQHSNARKGVAVVSIPLIHNDLVRGVITIQRSADRRFAADEVARMSTGLSPYGNAIKLIEKANRSLPRHAIDSSKVTLRRNARGRRLFCLAALGSLIAWMCLGTLPYRPLCETRVIAADLRHFSAPFGGKLQQVFVDPGQSVEAGQLLAEFDTVELRLQRNALRRELQAKQIEKKHALEADERAAAALHGAELQTLQAQIDAIEQQIREAKVVAPIAGSVMLGDLQQRVGQIFQQGEEVLQLAPPGDWMLEMEVPDSIISYVTATQSGSFAASALPTHRQQFVIEHIDGAAQVIGDKNVFVARGRLSENPVWMRSGMEGTARIEAIDRPVWWICFHSAVDWARINFWL
ncbi:MAG: HlyD family efflux transporter periplasmic adaptor subunit [Planctomycetaceae bacterium]